MLKEFLLVGAGGALGSMLRYAGNLLYHSKSFPLATFVINILGSFAIGMVMGWCLRNESSANWKLFLATGICGGFTTFSAFSFENLLLLQNGKIFLSLLYITGSVVAGIAAAWLGYKIIN
ncbi:MAG TPA: fluoride efflux transporter CrcB [Ferruginibacter sp.]|nr:fluoride efflux transporter CrcB [Ferruginibacter sp.]HPH92380.1 fluoride efflux transporter CrcB [Ferruginibacter sp.]